MPASPGLGDGGNEICAGLGKGGNEVCAGIRLARGFAGSGCCVDLVRGCADDGLNL